MSRRVYAFYKPSGVEWIGDVPEGWSILVLKRRSLVVMGQSPPSDEYSVDLDQCPFLQGNAEFGAVSPTAKWFCDSAPKSAPAGSILLSVRAPVGAMNWADRPYGIGRGLCAVLPRSHETNRSFLWYALTAARPLLESEATGSTFTAISANEVGNFRLVFPPAPEQAQIAEYLDRETAKIDELISKSQELIQRLKEKRSALITAAVTGKIDVREEETA